MISAHTLIQGLSAPASLTEFIFGRNPQEQTYAADADALFLGILAISTFVFFVLMGLMVYWAIKYRRRAGVAAPRSPGHNTALEVTWTAIPSVIFIAMFFVGFRAYAKMQTAPPDAVVMDLDAFKWSWNLRYKGIPLAADSVETGARPIPVFLVPEDTPIQLEMRSSDVLHSFWVPDFRFKMDVIPNRVTNYWFKTPKLKPDDRDNPDLAYPNREHVVYCAEYCGDQHSEMGAVLRVVPMDVFRAFLRNPIAPGTPPREVGSFIWQNQCSSCHSVDGSAGQGPTWRNLFGNEFSYTDGSRVVADTQHIIESILYPAAKIRSGYPNNMPSYLGQLNDQQLRGIVAYMRTLSDKSGEIEIDPFEADPDEQDESNGNNNPDAQGADPIPDQRSGGDTEG